MGEYRLALAACETTARRTVEGPTDEEETDGDHGSKRVAILIANILTSESGDARS